MVSKVIFVCPLWTNIVIPTKFGVTLSFFLIFWWKRLLQPFVIQKDLVLSILVVVDPKATISEFLHQHLTEWQGVGILQELILHIELYAQSHPKSFSSSLALAVASSMDGILGKCLHIHQKIVIIFQDNIKVNSGIVEWSSQIFKTHGHNCIFKRHMAVLFCPLKTLVLIVCYLYHPIHSN